MSVMFILLEGKRLVINVCGLKPRNGRTEVLGVRFLNMWVPVDNMAKY
jgi:hypothetical protein